jgi:hypothetical protein
MNVEKNGSISPLFKPDEDRCKSLVEKGYLKPIYGCWSGEISRYIFV